MDARPSPIFAERYFVPVNEVQRLLQPSIAALGIGQSVGSDVRGMSVLEGLVAAVEVRSAP